MHCPVCESINLQLKFPLTKENKIYRCLNCTTQFLFPQLDDESLNKLYSESYYKAWGLKGQEDNGPLKKMKIATFDLRLNLIQKYKPNGKILDVGCATGYFLEAAQKRGFECSGVEFSEYSSNIAKQKFGNSTIFHGTIEDCGFREKDFDVIAMSDLIEHVRNPLQTLKKAKALLKEDGIIMIITPNTDSLSNKLMKRRWTHYKPEHFFYFNKHSMNHLAHMLGLNLMYTENSRKAVNIEYLKTQFEVYQHWFFTPLIKFIFGILPSKIRRMNFYLSLGEMTFILKRL